MRPCCTASGLNGFNGNGRLNFLRECTPARTAENIRQIVAISEYSRQTLQAVRAETGVDYDCLTRGILHFYTDKKEFDESLPVRN